MGGINFSGGAAVLHHVLQLISVSVNTGQADVLRNTVL